MLTFLWGETVTHGAVSTDADNVQPMGQQATSLSSEVDRRFVRFFNGWEMFFRNSTQASTWSPVVESSRENEKLIFRDCLARVLTLSDGTLTSWVISSFSKAHV